MEFRCTPSQVLNSTSQLFSSADRCLRGPAYTGNAIQNSAWFRGVDVSRIIAGRRYQSRDVLTQ